MLGYIPIRVRSHYSLLSGASSVGALVEKAARLGLPALALTDENNLYGAVPFFQKAHELGIRPILGAIISGSTSEAVLLVRDAAGYANLCQIISERNLDREFSLQDAITQHQAGLFVLTPDPELATALAGDVQPEFLWLELLRPTQSVKERF